MKYTEPYLTYEQQAQRLLDAGLLAEKADLIQRLRDVGYYRLSAYMAPYRVYDETGMMTERFSPGATLEKVWDLYLFDRQLRLLFMDAIERIEVFLRVKIAHIHTRKNGPFGYADASYFPLWKGYMQRLEEIKLKKKIKLDHKSGTKQVIPTGIDFVDSFFSKYGDEHDYLPLWFAVGMFDYGTLIYFFNHSAGTLKREVANEFGVDAGSLQSWLFALRNMRNLCAHHGRVWNNLFPSSPHIPSPSHNRLWSYEYSEKAKKWVRPAKGWGKPGQHGLNAGMCAAFLFVCRQLLKSVAPTSHWKERVENCLHAAQLKGIPLAKTGLPEHWESHPIWI